MGWKDVLAKFVEAFLLGLAPIVASFIAAWVFAKVKAAWAEFKVNKPEVVWALETAATMAVQAAEQANLAGFIEDKQTYAIGVVERLLAEQGFTVELDNIIAAIEAAVWTEFNKAKQAEQGFTVELDNIIAADG